MAPYGGGRDYPPADPESRADHAEDTAHWTDLVIFLLLIAAVAAGVIWG